MNAQQVMAKFDNCNNFIELVDAIYKLSGGNPDTFADAVKGAAKVAYDSGMDEAGDLIIIAARWKYDPTFIQKATDYCFKKCMGAM